MSEKVRRSGKGVADGVARFRARSGLGEVAELRARVEELEAEVQECRKLNLRLAELTDLVTELLVPVAQSDPARVDELLERYSRSLG